MLVRIFSNEIETAVGPFIARFVGNVGAAITASLKAPRAIRKLEYRLDGDAVDVYIDDAAVTLDQNQGFAKTIVRDTLCGMLSRLKGIDTRAAIRIEIEFEHPN